MALPVTITGISTAVACVGPFRSSAGNFYFFGRDASTATTLQAYKSTAPTTSWSSIATKTGFTTGIQFISAYPVGDVVHMVVTDGATTSTNKKYQTFNMASDTFVTAETIVSAENTQTSASANAYDANIVVRSNGNVVVHYSAVRVSTFAQTAYKERTGVATWSAAVAVSTTGVNATNPITAMGSLDRPHFLWFNGTNTIQRHLTSANVLGTAASTGATALPQDAATKAVSGAVRCVGLTAASAFRWNAGSNPTVTNAALTTGTPVRAADIGGLFYALYQNSADSDLYIKSSADDGATWGSAVSAFVGTVASADANLSKNQMIYMSGANAVFPYIVNDAGTLKYNEYTIATPTADAWNVADKTNNVTLSNSDKTATLSSSVVAGIRSTTARANATTGKYYVEFLTVALPGFISLGITPVGIVDGPAEECHVSTATANIILNGSTIGSVGGALSAADVLCMAWDAGAERVWFRKNGGLWNNDAAADPATGTNGLDVSALTNVGFYLWMSSATSAASATVRTRVADLTITGQPAGFTSWMSEALVSNKTLPAGGGSYALTGTATPLLVKRRIDATTGASYALTGASTTNVLHKSRIDATVGGAYALTGASTTALLHKWRPAALGGSYGLTGTDAALTKAAGLVNKTLPAGSGSYALAGATASLVHAWKIAAGASSYSLAGSATTNVLHKSTITVGAGSYALAGADAAIIKRTFKTLAAVGGSYALTGSATGILHAWRPSASTGSYALTGTAATLTKFANKSLAAGSSSYALTGAATTNVRHGWKVTATTPGAYALAGSAATFVIHRDLLSAAPGAYALTGAAVAFSIRSDKFVSAATGSYALTGTVATLRRTYKPVAAAGAYALTGTAASPRYGRQVAAIAGNYSLAGSAASVFHGWKPAALSGSYALTGAPAVLQHVWKLGAIAGSYALAGSTASVLHRDRLTAIGGIYALTGTAALVRYGYKVPAGASSYALTGATALFPRKRVLTADPLIGRYTLTGKPALVLYRWTMRATGGAYAVTGTPAILRHARTIAAASTSYALTGSSVIINRIGLHSVLAEPGGYVLTGNVARIFTGEWSISDRTVQALAEVRGAAATAEIRSVKAIAETRLVKVAPEIRNVLALEEFRTIQARGESHGVSQMERQGPRRGPRLQHRLVTTGDEP